MGRPLEPDPSLPLVFVGEIVEVAFNGTGGARLDIVVAHAWPRLKARLTAPDPKTGRALPTLPEVRWCKTLYKTTLLGDARAGFMQYLNTPDKLKGRKIVLGGVPVAGIQMQDEEYIQVFHARAFLPSEAWLASFSASSELPVAKKA